MTRSDALKAVDDGCAEIIQTLVRNLHTGIETNGPEHIKASLERLEKGLSFLAETHAVATGAIKKAFPE